MKYFIILLSYVFTVQGINAGEGSHGERPKEIKNDIININTFIKDIDVDGELDRNQQIKLLKPTILNIIAGLNFKRGISLVDSGHILYSEEEGGHGGGPRKIKNYIININMPIKNVGAAEGPERDIIGLGVDGEGLPEKYLEEGEYNYFPSNKEYGVNVGGTESGTNSGGSKIYSSLVGSGSGSEIGGGGGYIVNENTDANPYLILVKNIEKLLGKNSGAGPRELVNQGEGGGYLVVQDIYIKQGENTGIGGGGEGYFTGTSSGDSPLMVLLVPVLKINHGDESGGSTIQVVMKRANTTIGGLGGGGAVGGGVDYDDYVPDFIIEGVNVGGYIVGKNKRSLLSASTIYTGDGTEIGGGGGINIGSREYSYASGEGSDTGGGSPIQYEGSDTSIGKRVYMTNTVIEQIHDSGTDSGGGFVL